MRFTAEHRFPASPAAVAAILGDPGFYETLELPDLTLLDASGSDEPPSGDRRISLRYEFTGSLDPMARRLLGGARLTWKQEVVIRGEGDDSSGALSFAAEASPRILHGSAEFALTPLQGTVVGCVRHLAGDLVVAVPGLGGRAERRIVPGVLRRLDVEAEAVRSRLGPPC